MRNGNLVRHYNTNKRLRSINTRAVSLSQNQFDVATKINQVIGRLNDTNFFSVGMTPLVPRAPFTAPMPGLYAVDQSTASDPGVHGLRRARHDGSLPARLEHRWSRAT
jgi:hypothetical protein